MAKIFLHDSVISVQSIEKPSIFLERDKYLLFIERQSEG